MSKYLSIMRQVDNFSEVFGPFILSTLSIVFVMCLCFFYAVVKQGILGVVDHLVFVGNGLQILTRLVRAATPKAI
jgi:hypothetical protein